MMNSLAIMHSLEREPASFLTPGVVPACVFILLGFADAHAHLRPRDRAIGRATVDQDEADRLPPWRLCFRGDPWHPGREAGDDQDDRRCYQGTRRDHRGKLSSGTLPLA